MDGHKKDPTLVLPSEGRREESEVRRQPPSPERLWRARGARR